MTGSQTNPPQEPDRDTQGKSWGKVSGSTTVYLGIIVLLGFAPPFLSLINEPFYLDLLSRMLILGIAALSLNLILGYGGMISMGHAAYLGIGAYCVGIPAYYEIYNGFVHLALAIVLSGIFAFLSGIISLRTKGVYFIMITLAFTQMLYFTFVSLEEYGGDDGLVIELRSEFPGLFDTENNTNLYYCIYLTLLGSLLLVHRLIQAPFGRVIIGSKHNEERMRSLGYNTYRYRLVCYVISGILCGIAGVFLGNFTSFISPEMMDWTHSGELIFMIVIGGVNSLFGPLIGSMLFIFFEEWLSGITVYWHFIFGLMLIALVLFGKGGINGLITALFGERR
ncbi:MAG: branched-chain amino acid ABC transporter permease [Gammaproteobacteria bacterium]|nr:branched-chain amino acid ABC transporter permease [Gammaproteobacteria bacterium]